MLNKHEGNLLLVSALVCIPMLLLQGVLLAPPASPLTLLLVLMTTLTGFALLLFLTHSVRRGGKDKAGATLAAGAAAAGSRHARQRTGTNGSAPAPCVLQ